MKAQKGFTLIELLVSLLIGLLVAVAVADFFTKSNRSYLLNESRSQVQDRGRFATNLLSRQIRSSMSWGCLGQDTSLVDSHLVGDALTEPAARTRFYPYDSAELPSEVKDRVKKETEVLKVAGFIDHGLRVSDHDQDNAFFDLQNTRQAEFLDIKQGEYVLVIDAQCTQGHLLQVSNQPVINEFDNFAIEYKDDNDLQPSNKSDPLDFDYSDILADFSGGANLDYSGRLLLFEAAYYFLSEVDGRSYLKVYRPSKDQLVPLVPGVKKLRFLAGVGSAGNLDGYFSRSDVSDWDSVRSIRIDALVTSDSGSAPGQKTTQQFAGKSYTFENQHAEIFTLVTAIRIMNL